MSPPVAMPTETAGRLVRLVAYGPGHVDPLYQAVAESIADLFPYETWCQPGYSREQAAAYIDGWRRAWSEGTGYYYAVEALDSGVFVGSCGLSGVLPEHGRAGLGYWIRSSRTGKGYATDAAHAVTRLGVEVLQLGRIEIESAVTNAASLRVAAKLGYRREAVLRRRLVLPDGPTDTVMLALVRDDEA